MGNVNMEASQINYRGGSKKMSVEEAIKAAGTEITPEEKEWIDTIPELASQEIIAPEFDAEEGVYAVGDLVIYQGGLYQFTTAHETAEAWNAEEVAAVKVSDEIDSLKSGLMSKTAIVANGEISSNSSVTAQLVSGHLYIVILGHPYSEGGIAIIASYTSGSNKVTWIKSKTGVTITEDDNVVLTIAADATVWYTVVDMGTAYN